MNALKITMLCFITIGLFLIFVHEMSEMAAAEVSQSGMSMDSVAQGKAFFKGRSIGLL